jgi:CheY-like chemotaxis protein
MVARVLETAGYTVVPSGSSRETVRALQELRPDLLLLDPNAPGSEAWAAMDRIRTTFSELPIILITGWPNLSPFAAQLGIHCLMEKPLDLPLLLEEIRRLVSESPQHTRQSGEAAREPAFGARLDLAAAFRR